MARKLDHRKSNYRYTRTFRRKSLSKDKKQTHIHINVSTKIVINKQKGDTLTHERMVRNLFLQTKKNYIHERINQNLFLQTERNHGYLRMYRPTSFLTDKKEPQILKNVSTKLFINEQNGETWVTVGYDLFIVQDRVFVMSTVSGLYFR